MHAELDAVKSAAEAASQRAKEREGEMLSELEAVQASLQIEKASTEAVEARLAQVRAETVEQLSEAAAAHANALAEARAQQEPPPPPPTADAEAEAAARAALEEADRRLQRERDAAAAREATLTAQLEEVRAGAADWGNYGLAGWELRREIGLALEWDPAGAGGRAGRPFTDFCDRAAAGRVDQRRSTRNRDAGI